MKKMIKALLAASILLTAVTGCSEKDTGKETDSSDYNIGGDYSTGYIVSSSGSDESEALESSYAETSEPPEENTVRFYEKSISSKGKVVKTLTQSDNLYMMAMDNNYVYFESNGPLPKTISSLDRSDYSSLEKVMTYNFQYMSGGNNYTYCGCFFVFPSGGDYEGMTDNYWTDRAHVGKTGEQAKIVFNDHDPRAGFHYRESAELSDSEMVFMFQANNDIDIYKYKTGDEQAQLIYAETLSDSAGSPAITCCNGQIYLICKSDSYMSVDIKILNPDGEVAGLETISLPECPGLCIYEFTVTENNYLINYRITKNNSDVYNMALVDRKSKSVFSDFGTNKPGKRFNDSKVDGRYIIFLKSYYLSAHPILCVFDDKTSEFYIMEFTELRNPDVSNIAVDYKGDVMFMVKEDGEMSLVLYEDITSLI